MVIAAQPYGEPATALRPAQRRAGAGLWSCGPPASHRTKIHRSPILPATKPIVRCGLWGGRAIRPASFHGSGGLPPTPQ